MAASSPAKFLFGFLLVSIVLWLLFIFASRLAAWLLSRILGGSVAFRVDGWKCLRDIVIKFKKGPIESVSVGEIKVSLRQSLVKLGAGFLFRDPKLQVLICDLEVVIRPSNKSKQKAKTRRRTRSTSGRGKWMVVANMARFLSVSITDLLVKTPKATAEAKDLNLNIFKDGGSSPNLFVKLHVAPVIIHLGEPRISCDQSSTVDSEGCSSSQGIFTVMDRSTAPFICEELLVSCKFGHDRELGIVVKNLQVNSGEVMVNINEAILLKKSSSSALSQADVSSSLDSIPAEKPRNKEAKFAALTKYAKLFPDEVCFILPKLDVKFIHREHDLFVENNIMGIQLRCLKSHSSEDVGESTRLDIQMDFSEIHLLRESGTSVVEILKVDIVSFVYIPVEPVLPVRAEVDVKLGGTQFNMVMSRIKPWLRFKLSKKKKKTLKEVPSPAKRPKSSESTIIMWTCTVSAPELTIVLYGFNGKALYHGCSQSSHIFANNISNNGTSIHMELGELNLHMEDEYQECVKENLFGVESNSGSLVHVAKISLDWGSKEMEESVTGSKLVLSVDVTGMGVSFTFKRVESLILTALSFQTLLKSLSASRKGLVQSHGSHASTSSGKGMQLVKLSLESCSISLCGEAGLENTTVPDPKRVNYGSQGGRIIISVSADGTQRTATVMSTAPQDCKKLNYCVSLDLLHLSLCLNKEKQSTQMELERARSIYQEYLEEHKPCTEVELLDIQNAKFVRRPGGHKDISICSLFSATDITVRWEPDVHLSLFEFVLQVKSLIYHHKLQQSGSTRVDNVQSLNSNQEKEVAKGSGYNVKQKKESIFALDVETLTVSAGVGDGVEALVQVQSIFSENARIGILFEGCMLRFNGARILRSSRMQISRIPSVSTNSSDAKMPAASKWDWVVQGFDIHICMPFRLELRAIDDSVEDMLRALKLILAARTRLAFTSKNETSKPKKPSSTKLWCVKFCIRKVTADIEEEPIQGWLDEHYQLMKHEACELAVRLRYLNEAVKGYNSSSVEANDDSQERKFCHEGVELDVQDPAAIGKLKEEMYKRSFQAYFQACQKLKPSDGSGVCLNGYQAGFRPSARRTSLLSISATELDMTLTSIIGGDVGMVEIINKLDRVSNGNNIPFSRLYGSNILLHTGSLVVQIRDYTYPLFSATVGKCEGRVVLAQQATSFQPQIHQEVYVGRWRKVRMLRSASGTTPPMKTYSDLPIHFQKAEVSFGVGYEPSFADISYAFTVALRRANLSVRNPGPLVLPPKKEKSLPWWDDMRNYIHGNISLFFSQTRWYILATIDPYEKLDKLQMTSGHMEIKQSDGRVFVSARDFNILVSSLESLGKNRSLKPPVNVSDAFLKAPVFTLEVTMDWGCESGNPLNHYLFALPYEGKPRDKVFDPFRSTSLSLRWNFSFRPPLSLSDQQYSTYAAGDIALVGETARGCISENVSSVPPTFNVGAHDLAWLLKFWNMNYVPPHKLRSFSRWPRFGVPRAVRSGNLSLDRVMTEFMLRVDASPSCIKHVSLADDDPAKGLTFTLSKFKYELCYSRGKQKYTFECKREPLDLVYQGLDLHAPKAFLDRDVDSGSCVSKVSQMTRKNSQSASVSRVPSEKGNHVSSCTEKHRDEGFLLSCDYFTIRKQAQKADPARLLAWQEAGRRNLEMTYVRSEFENGSESDEHAQSDQSDDDGYNVVIADNCQCVFVYGLKLLWTIENRDAVWSWVGGISKAFEAPKPSPSRLYAQRKLHQENQVDSGADLPQSDVGKVSAGSEGAGSPSVQVGDSSTLSSSPSHLLKTENLPLAATAVKTGSVDDSEEGTRRWMVNVIEPQFNLHSEEANGRFLLAAVSGRVMARSFHSISEHEPDVTWKRMEFSVMLERVQAHVAPTDVDPGAGLQWLPKILKSSAKVKRTGALLERVFMPCDMYFQYTRHKGWNPDKKVKPLKELTFNSDDITATMTSRQFQVMLDVLTNLLFARLPKPRKSSLAYPGDDDEDVEEEADEVVPNGVEEVELAKIDLEQKEREQKLIIDDIRKLSYGSDSVGDQFHDKEGELWMLSGGKSVLIQELKRELVNAQKLRKSASSDLRMTLQKAAQLRLMEKEKNKSPSYAMCIDMEIKKVVWGMLVDGKSFAEAEINDMIYKFERDYKDTGVASFTTKCCVVRNCLPNAKSDTLLSAWNAPPEWGKKVILRVDAKQGAPRDGNSILELFQVEIYPLKIHLTETMYRMMWEYFFPEEEQDSQRRQEVWKVSTTAGAKRVKKGSAAHEASTSSGLSVKEAEVSSRSTVSGTTSFSVNNQSSTGDSLQASKLQNPKANIVCGSNTELRRTSSFDRTWEENVAESVANEIVLDANSLAVSSAKNGPPYSVEQQDESSKNRSKDSKPVKPGRSSHEDKKVGKAQEEKRARPRRLMEFHNIKISQVELLVTYEGSRFVVNDLKLLMDTFHRVEFTGTWRRLFSRVKKHIIWGVLKSVTGMQGKKFKDKLHSQRDQNATGVPESDLNFSDNEGGQAEKSDDFPAWPRRNDGAGDGFVTSIKGLFNTQRQKAKKFVLRTMRGEADNDLGWSESDPESAPFARQLTITKAKKLIRRHTKKFRPRGQKGSSSQPRDSLPSSPRETTPFEGDISSGSSSYEDA